MSRSETIPPVDEDLLRPGDRVLVRERPRRPRVAGVVTEINGWACLVRLRDGRELVRQHSELRRSGWQPARD